MNIDNDFRSELLNFHIDGANYQNCFQLYVYLLMYAKFEDGCINGIELKRGQCLTSITKLSEKTGLSEQNIRTAIKKLIEAGYIKKYATKKYTILTMCHYDKKYDKKKNADVQDKYPKEQQGSPNCNKEQDIINKQESRLQELREKAIAGTLTPEEAEEFNNWRR